MSSDEISPDAAKHNSPEAPMHDTPTGPAAMATTNKKRPRLDLNAGDPRERKRGKSMFGLVLGTLNKAKVEDKERNASEAAKKRQLIEQRLQAKLRKETDSVRRAEEAKKDKTSANRREEELQLKDSIYKLRRTRLPLLANFLLTSDHIPTSDDDDMSPPPSKNILSSAPRTHPPPLYYLPAILTPAQEAFLTQRKAEVKEAAKKEWQTFKDERAAGVEEIKELRQRVAEELERRKVDRESRGEGEADKDTTAVNDSPTADKPKDGMDVDDAPAETAAKDESKDATVELDAKDEPAAMQADDDDAVEY
ncbi:hypothetical protein PILCRDRAFT_825056 [Piloderma croceum F 1598]|uniref:Pinin/SDK/MemA protein domain-containing protein n=1 Tax=Piloderma croceum (strain F 1598) TaxID=765440 RepID=A0A0C3FD95_PILCF|nr:hypothetical protein PILCRDRAFT_825056 [Piloderma croceum F 1598]